MVAVLGTPCAIPPRNIKNNLENESSVKIVSGGEGVNGAVEVEV
jgi:hypothetical protein